MKKYIVSLVFLLLCNLAIAQNQFATVLKVAGDVKLRAKGRGAFSTKVTIGMGINSGDAVKTGSDGFVAIIFTEDKSLLKIRNDSEIELIKDNLGARTSKVAQGKVLAEITPGLKSSFRIETSTSVASVKGTKFWTVSIPNFGDKFYGVEGQVSILNLITGMETDLEPGQMVASTVNGEIFSMPVDPDEIPTDPEETKPEKKEPTEPSGMEMKEGTEMPEMGATGQPPAESVFEEGKKEGGEKKSKPYGMGLGLGSVTIDGKIYNQIALRPEFKFGKLGVSLDIAFYMDENGNIRKNEWDEFTDYIDKLYYVRWAQQGDPFFIKIGALDNVSMGYGILLNGYSNTTEYPQVRKVGIHTGMQRSKIGWEAYMANLKEITGPGLMAGRLTYKPIEKLPLILGTTVVADVYPYKGLPDADEDDVADALDLYPGTDDNVVLDSLKTSFTLSQREFLRNNGFNIPSETVIQNGITKLSDYDRLLNGAVSVDVGMPVLNKKFFNLTVYGQAASFIPVEDSAVVYNSATQSYDRVAFTPGYGFAVPGVKMGIARIANLTLEYRYAGENFLFNYWDRAYDYERVQIRNNQIYTKQQMSLMQSSMQGVYGAVDVNILNYFILGGYYQHMFSEGTEIKSFMASASIPKGIVPKLADATAFYQRNNDENPFDFKNPSENTILGYKIGFELGGGAIIYYKFQRTYRDFDGNGKVDPNTEAVNLTTIETGFSF
ncbi:MAG TPA: FecR family protein [Candidatus Marinimicrobia bacterium]|nr:FecR family protein [Candidatus Neomarinimicrobiota bacterium]HRS51287.1 FecR family protein [Candidatus Neomarinimicrobiota bacterium]HRU91475.1 FecR family protein [Candidatus Neomarinimicrobiota bacterium]